MKIYELNTLGNTSDLSLCQLGHHPAGMGTKYTRLSKGLSVKEFYPENAIIKMSDEGYGSGLSSMIGHDGAILIFHKDVVELLHSFCSEESIEFFHFTLLDLKEKPVSDEYFVVNPLGTVDCLNTQKSELIYKNGKLKKVNRVVFSKEATEEVPALFRITEAPRKIFLREDLYTTMVEREFSNIVVSEVEIV